MKSTPKESGEKGKPRQVPNAGIPESPASRESFPEREKRPGEVGLANEPRPGLGSRTDEAAVKNDEVAAGTTPAKSKSRKRYDEGDPKATRYGYEEPRPEPREQPSDSWAHQEERSTGASGNSGGV